MPLVASRLRRTVLALVGVSVLVVAVLGAIVAGRTSTAFDTRVYRALFGRIAERTEWRLMDSTHPVLITTVIAVIAVAALVARRWRLVVLSVLAPPVALGLTELVLKPLVGRQINGFVTVAGSYPSGHETGVATAALLVVVALGQLRMPGWARALVAVVPAVWVATAAVALVRGHYHYATDTIGALGVSAVVVLSGAIAIDTAGAARSRRAATDAERPRAEVGRPG